MRGGVHDGSETTARYSPEFRAEAVRLPRDRIGADPIAKELGSSWTTLRNWMQAGHAPARPLTADERTESEPFRREVVRLREERDILKKASGSSPDKERLFFARLRVWPTSSHACARAWGLRQRLLRVAGRAGSAGPGARLLGPDPGNASSDRTYGTPRVVGFAGGRSQRGPQGHAADARRTCGQNAPAPWSRWRILCHPANRLARPFRGSAERVWGADFTSMRPEGWLFLAVVLDLFSRRVVGWAMRPARDPLVMDALLMAIWRRAARRLHHSDHGSQYTSEGFQRAARHGIVQHEPARKLLG